MLETTTGIFVAHVPQTWGTVTRPWTGRVAEIGYDTQVLDTPVS
jgi:hypothetical protein